MEACIAKLVRGQVTQPRAARDRRVAVLPVSRRVVVNCGDRHAKADFILYLSLRKNDDLRIAFHYEKMGAEGRDAVHYYLSSAR
jgi:hypothetical protein